MKTVLVPILFNILFAFVTYDNAFSIEWEKCEDSLRHLEDDANRGVRSAEEIKVLSLKIADLKLDLTKCSTASYKDCSSINSDIKELSLKIEETKVRHHNNILSAGFSFANMQIDCDHDLNFVNKFNDKSDNRECQRLISFMQLYNIDNITMHKSCIEKKRNDNTFCNKCFNSP